MGASVLLVEDEAEIRQNIKITLESEGYKVTVLENGEGLLSQLEKDRPDVVLLDQILPGKTGTDLIREIRAARTFENLPVILVTGCSSEDEKVYGLGMGADDYITKPFSKRELVARVRALHRRANVSPALVRDRIQNGDLELDLAAHRALLSGQELALTLTEFKILTELLGQAGRVLTRAQLCEKVLGRMNVTDRTIDVHVAALRKKLAHRGDDIQTVRGVGYRFAVAA